MNKESNIIFTESEIKVIIDGQREFLRKEKKKHNNDWDKGFEAGVETILKSIEILIECKK